MGRRAIGGLAALCLAAAAITTGTGTAAASAGVDTCRLIQTPLNYSALNYGWAQGLDGCSGDVVNTWQTAPSSTGPWTAQEPYPVHYDDEYASYWVYEGDLCYRWHRLTATYGTQSITTNAVLGTGSEPC